VTTAPQSRSHAREIRGGGVKTPVRLKKRSKHSVIEWPLSKFSPYARNPRRNDDAVEKMIASIREFGFKIPILARSNGEIVDGHLRLKGVVAGNANGAFKLDRLPVILCDEWSAAQVKAFRLLANRSVAWASWDEELVGLELEELRELKFDLDLTGFEATEIEKFLASGDVASPEQFNEYDETIETEFQCPKCGYRWSGTRSMPVTTDEPAKANGKRVRA
jgi:ParB-like chromosome segregation protein Spo0J